MAVAMDRALIPGSNTPRPPACHTQSWCGCQWRTSSRQTISTLASLRPFSQSAAGATPGASRECQEANRVTPLVSATAHRSCTSLTVMPGGFSRNTCLRAARASRA